MLNVFYSLLSILIEFSFFLGGGGVNIYKKLAAGYAKMERRFAASSLEGGRSGAKTDDTSDVVDIRSLSSQFTFLSAWKVSFIVFYDSRMEFYITFIVHHK